MRRLQAGSDESIQETANDAASGKLSAASLGYFHDPFLSYFVEGTAQEGPRGHGAGPPARRLPPVINRGNFARVACIEKLVQEFLAPGPATPEVAACREADGAAGLSHMASCRPRASQVISFGAGKDTLFFRLKEKGLAPLGGYMEVDFEPVTLWKAHIVARTPALDALASSREDSDSGAAITAKAAMPHAEGPQGDFGASSSSSGGGDRMVMSPGEYRLVPADLRHTEALEAALVHAGVDFSAPTIFLAECVLVYMETAQSLALLQWCASNFPDSMFAAYEMTRPGDAFGRMMRQNIQRMGCLLPGLEPYPSLEAQQQRFIGAGWDSCRVADMLAVFECFLDPAEVRRASKIEVFDEVEEWELIMRHYCLVVAANGKDAVARLNSLRLSSEPERGDVAAGGISMAGWNIARR